jgi:hypothetical protein
MSLSELIGRYGTDDLCEAPLRHARWPAGFVCPECGEREHSIVFADGRRYWQCSGYRRLPRNPRGKLRTTFSYNASSQLRESRAAQWMSPTME